MHRDTAAAWDQFVRYGRGRSGGGRAESRGQAGKGWVEGGGGRERHRLPHRSGVVYLSLCVVKRFAGLTRAWSAGPAVLTFLCVLSRSAELLASTGVPNDTDPGSQATRS